LPARQVAADEEREGEVDRRGAQRVPARVREAHDVGQPVGDRRPVALEVLLEQPPEDPAADRGDEQVDRRAQPAAHQ
jgi:hypothetical protein